VRSPLHSSFRFVVIVPFVSTTLHQPMAAHVDPTTLPIQPHSSKPIAMKLGLQGVCLDQKPNPLKSVRSLRGCVVVQPSTLARPWLPNPRQTVIHPNPCQSKLWGCVGGRGRDKMGCLRCPDLSIPKSKQLRCHVFVNSRFDSDKTNRLSASELVCELQGLSMVARHLVVLLCGCTIYLLVSIRFPT